MNSEAKKILHESMTEDIPLNSNGRVDANAHRIQQSRNLKSAILLLLETDGKVDKHIEDNKKSFTIINKAVIGMSVIFSVSIIGIVAGWTIAGVLAFFGSAIKGVSWFVGKS